MCKDSRVQSISLGQIVLRSISIDDIATVRHLHATVLKIVSSQHLGDAEVDKLIDSINSCEYISAVADSNMTGAWVDGHLAGTAAWEPVGAGRPEARLHMLFVWPLFARAGIGSALVANAETEAYQAGCRAMRARTEVNQAGFFVRVGYTLSSHGAMRTPAGATIPVVYMRKEKILPALDMWNADSGKAAVGYKH